MKSTSYLPGILTAVMISSFFASPSIVAQEKRNKALRILAVGQPPPFRQKIENGRRIELPPPPGSVPPHQMQLSNAEGAEVGSAVNIRLNVISKVVGVAGGTIPLHSVGDSGFSPEVWHKLKYPGRSAAALAILWRGPKGKWDTASELVLPDDTRAFPAGRVRIVNVSKYPIALLLGAEKGLLKPGQAILREGKSGVFKKVPFVLKIKDASGRYVRVFAQEINQASTERTHIVLYTNDGEEKDKPVKAVVLRERGLTPKVRGARRNP